MHEPVRFFPIRSRFLEDLAAIPEKEEGKVPQFRCSLVINGCLCIAREFSKSTSKTLRRKSLLISAGRLSIAVHAFRRAKIDRYVFVHWGRPPWINRPSGHRAGLLKSENGRKAEQDIAVLFEFRGAFCRAERDFTCLGCT